MSAWSRNTSGDLIADRRYAWGDAALKEGDWEAACDLFRQTLEQAPNWPPAHLALGNACLAGGDHCGARQALNAVLALDPEDSLGAGLVLARLEGAATRAAMPDAFVAALFDDYAARFDSHLVEALAYNAPAQLAAMLARYPGRPCATVYDLGCGTGLMAQALPGAARWFGVDLSAAMLERAAITGRYHALERAELLAWLQAQPAGSADLVLAADVLCYVPELAPVLAAVRQVLAPRALFAFSVQTHAGEGAIVGVDMRVHHAPALVLRLAQEAGLELLDMQETSTRLDRGVPVPGALFLFSRDGK